MHFGLDATLLPTLKAWKPKSNSRMICTQKERVRKKPVNTKMADVCKDYKQKEALVLVYTGEGKGKTSASMGLMTRALGTDWSVAFIQFIKHWEVGEHRFIAKIQPLFKDKLYFFKGGKGFYNAGELSAKGVSEAEHKQAEIGRA